MGVNRDISNHGPSVPKSTSEGLLNFGDEMLDQVCLNAPPLRVIDLPPNNDGAEPLWPPGPRVRCRAAGKLVAAQSVALALAFPTNFDRDIFRV